MVSEVGCARPRVVLRQTLPSGGGWGLLALWPRAWTLWCLLIKALTLLDQGPTRMASSSLNYFLSRHLQMQPCWVLGLPSVRLEGHEYSAHNTHQRLQTFYSFVIKFY